jgi:hypothetical protein
MPAMGFCLMFVTGDNNIERMENLQRILGIKLVHRNKQDEVVSIENEITWVDPDNPKGKDEDDEVDKITKKN